MTERFDGSFTRQEPIPEEGIAAALSVMQTGRLHRYNTGPGETAEAARLEADFAAFTGARYCLAVASGGYALATALRAVGVRPGEPVLSNGFTLAPVPGAIAAVGARPVFVETTEALTIDLDDLAAMARETGARLLMLSHMRGHIADMAALMAVARAAGLTVIEDCAHTMGAEWDGLASGRHGAVACYSTQTYKHINSGEGGLIASDDPAIMARATVLSGSYMFMDRHGAGPERAAYDGLAFEVPNISGRMDNLRAAVLRPQLAVLPDRVARWNRLYRAVEDGLRGAPGIVLIDRPAREAFVGSSFQFRMPGLTADAIAGFVAGCAGRGVELKWFGADAPHGFTSRYDHWAWAGPQRLPKTDAILARLLDMRLPLTFTEADCATIARIIGAEAARAAATRAA
jgi:dTDP-4-amino-4,6-dideoxygalactose transaminase